MCLGSLMAGRFQALTAGNNLILLWTSRALALQAPEIPLAKQVYFRVTFCLTIASCLDRISPYNHRGGVLELVTLHDLSPHILPHSWLNQAGQLTHIRPPGLSVLEILLWAWEALNLRSVLRCGWNKGMWDSHVLCCREGWSREWWCRKEAGGAAYRLSCQPLGRPSLTELDICTVYFSYLIILLPVKLLEGRNLIPHIFVSS